MLSRSSRAPGRRRGVERVALAARGRAFATILAFAGADFFAALGVGFLDGRVFLEAGLDFDLANAILLHGNLDRGAHVVHVSINSGVVGKSRAGRDEIATQQNFFCDT